MAILLHEEQVGDYEVAEELTVDWVASIDLHFEVFDELLEHLLKHSKFNVVVHGKNLNGDCLIHGKNLLDRWAGISNQDSGGFLELSLLEIGLGELHQISVQDFGTLFLGKAQTLLPLTSL